MISLTTSANPSSNLDAPEEVAAFPNFSKLPREIRLMIWEFSAPPPRIVHIFERFLKGDWQIPGFEQDLIEDLDPNDWISNGELVDDTTQWAIGSDSPWPEILFTCHEAYDALKREYAPKFVFNAVENPKAFPQTPFSRRDTMYISASSAFSRFAHDPDWEEVINRIQYLGLGQQLRCVENLAFCPFVKPILDNRDFSVEWFVSAILQCFGGVKHLTLVSEQVDFREDLKSEHVWSQKRRTDMVMVGLINSEAALRTRPEPLESDSAYASREAQYDIGVLAAFDMDELVYYRTKCNHTWEMPIIEFKTIVNRERKDRLDRMRSVREARYRSEESLNPASA